METTITRRTRNLGFAWTNQPVTRRNPATGAEWLTVAAPETPDETGLTARQLATRIAGIRRSNSGNHYAYSVFVGNERVGSDDGFGGDLAALLAGETDAITVRLA